MSEVLRELVDLLALERIEENLFRGQSQDLGWGLVYGGQVLGQALSAAVQTVPSERAAHSLHAYFLRPGDVSRPIVYDVDRIRDGRSFTTRRVVAIQNGRAIFHLSASFQIREPGLTHQDDAPRVPAPDTLQTDRERAVEWSQRLPEPMRERATSERPFEMRTIDPDENPFDPRQRAATKQFWLRATGDLPDDPALHRYLLAYASDFSFLTTSLRPHGATWLDPKIQVASIDHAMWFHRPFRVDEWLLHDVDSPSASGARGLVRGRVFSADGTLVASTAQEGLIRQHE